MDETLIFNSHIDFISLRNEVFFMFFSKPSDDLQPLN